MKRKQLKFKLRKYNQVKDLFIEHDLEIKKSQIFNSLKIKFILWCKNSYTTEFNMKLKSKFTDDPFISQAKQDAIILFNDFCKLEGFFPNIVGTTKGWDINVSSLSHKRKEKNKKKIEKYKKKNRSDHDFLFSMVSHQLNTEIFEYFFCKGKESYIDKKSNKKFKEICKIIYENEFPDYANRKDKTSSRSDHQDECFKLIKKKILFHKYGKVNKLTVVEAFMEKQYLKILNEVKKHYK